MKRSYLLPIFAILALLLSLCSCSSGMIDTDTVQEAESHYPSTVNADVAPSYNSATQVFDNIRSLKRALENDTTTLYTVSSEISVYYELIGLPSGYVETSVEWTGSSDYCVYYSHDDSVIAYIPVSSENALTSMLENLLQYSGTYEYLAANTMVNSLTKTSVSTTLGWMYECTYNTSKKTGLKLNYHEYTNEETNITYIISRTYTQTGDILNSKLFVFNGSASFVCIGSETNISMETACNLTSVPIS